MPVNNWFEDLLSLLLEEPYYEKRAPESNYGDNEVLNPYFALQVIQKKFVMRSVTKVSVKGIVMSQNSS